MGRNRGWRLFRRLVTHDIPITFQDGPPRGSGKTVGGVKESPVRGKGPGMDPSKDSARAKATLMSLRATEARPGRSGKKGIRGGEAARLTRNGRLAIEKPTLWKS